jgi:hypothetical protein
VYFEGGVDKGSKMRLYCVQVLEDESKVDAESILQKACRRSVSSGMCLVAVAVYETQHSGAMSKDYDTLKRPA